MVEESSEGRVEIPKAKLASGTGSMDGCRFRRRCDQKKVHVRTRDVVWRTPHQSSSERAEIGGLPD